MSVVEAVERDLAAIRRLDADLASSGLAATALALAEMMDEPNSATSKSMCARALTETLDRLRELTPQVEEGDRIDDLADRRARRVSTATG